MTGAAVNFPAGDSKAMEELSLPEDVIQPLFEIAKSFDLKEALQILVKISRIDDGRADLASKNVLPLVLKLCQSIPYSSGCDHLALCLKLLRNLCAGNVTNQSLFVALNGPRIVSAFFSSVPEPDHGIIRFGLQVLANVCLAGREHQQAIWRCFFPDDFSAIAKVRSQGTCDPLCLVLYVCCDGNASLLVELCGDKGLPIVGEIVRTASMVSFRENWFKNIVSWICLDELHFRKLFSILYSGCDSEESDSDGKLFSTEQAFFLSIMSEIINERLMEIAVSIDFASCVFGILKKSIGIVGSVSRGKSVLPTGNAAVDVLGYSLTILRDICAQPRKDNLDDDLADVVDTILSYGLLELLVVVLRDLEPPVIIKRAIKQSDNQEETPSESYSPCPYKGFRRDVVAVIGNCAFQRKSVQDEIRQKNGMLLMLQQCVTDEDNPFLREWGIWCVRNLLEGNVENQKTVAELELQGTVDVAELSGLGLRVEVDPNTRRAKLVNMSPNASWGS
ncbi:uncharacterized protein LOC126653584 [Mercurialis annua]|uniref:uncharacterized protein LOC126653584 n=1 Tax=Mercurialis annua TaxID=3986 RepID=UPI00215FC155|nr:uncharacterized protein LOC126653584 [Mercurialis annua]